MSDTKGYTGKGWKVWFDGHISDENGYFICSLPWESYREFEEGNNKAIARLIAAAPDMLDFIKDVEKFFTDDYDHAAILAQASRPDAYRKGRKDGIGGDA